MTNLLPRIEFLVQSLVRRQQACPHCESRSPRVVARKHGVVRIKSCESCSLVFTDPIYERSVFGPLYDRLYGAEGSTTALPDQERLGELLATSFRGTDKDFHDRLEALVHRSPGPRLLEIGSSWGYFLFQANQHGFEACGVEPSGPRRAFGREKLGVEILPSLEALGERRFDLVYTAHTLEHFTDLRGVLPALRERLVPGGELVLEVPRVDLEGDRERSLRTVGAVHPLGFDSEFFRRNLPRAGFEVLGFFSSWDSFPQRPEAGSSGDVVLVRARATAEGPSELVA